MKKSKSFTLLSGKEDDCFWSIVCTTNCDGSFRKIGDIHIRNKEYNQKYFQNHKEECLKRKREWRRKNQKKDREYYQQYRKNHREKINEQSREWRAMHKEELRKRYRMYYENNEKRRLQMKKHASSRREYLGYIPLNTPFPGACGHHIDKYHVIFIPKELHRSIYHSVLKKNKYGRNKS